MSLSIWAILASLWLPVLVLILWEARDRKWVQDPLTLFTGLLAIGTIALAVVAVLQWETLENSDLTLKETLAANKTVQRAFITVVDVAIDNFHQKLPNVEGDLFWRFTPTIENSGTTPTKNLRWATSISNEGPIVDFDRLGIDFEPLIKNNKNAWRFGTLGPKAKMNLTHSANRLELHESWIPLMASNKASFTWQGVIRYSDVFPGTEEHVTNFCYVVSVYSARDDQTPYLRQCSGRKNCVDDECK
jgi:hypothetical protein